MTTTWICQACGDDAHERVEECRFFDLSSKSDRCICGETRIQHERGKACPQFDDVMQFVTGNFQPL